ncbi:hypothetical protein C8R45DRAFT_935291 [Mycena sanguinolenta]|nr:hypothetical protein C8R45DRAFT_935291 [Mycena sanguinolenta]
MNVLEGVAEERNANGVLKGSNGNIIDRQAQARPSPSRPSPHSQFQTPLSGASRFAKPVGQVCKSSSDGVLCLRQLACQRQNSYWAAVRSPIQDIHKPFLIHISAPRRRETNPRYGFEEIFHRPSLAAVTWMSRSMLGPNPAIKWKKLPHIDSQGAVELVASHQFQISTKNSPSGETGLNE